MRPAKLLAMAMLACASTSLFAGRMIIQRSPLAGFTHHAAAELWPRLAEGGPARTRP